MRYRQIHLDFHTSEHIPGIGSRFDPDKFADTFARADVDSVTVFSKCHHGWSYHPTKVGEHHPHLDFDLLKAQLDALHKRNIKAPIYLSAGWDEKSAREHPGLRVVSPEGQLIRQRGEPLGPGWAWMDFNSPYLDYLCRQVEEVGELFPVNDGLFIDICASNVTVSAWAQKKLEARGLDWTDPRNQEKLAEETQIEFFERVRAAGLKNDPNRRIFFNFGHIRRGRRDILKYFSHLEIESLPTAFWGYEHFPISARYVDTLGIDFPGMTGKFHNLWGEVGGYKKADALLYECGAMIAQGVKCSIGDHLHPTGEIDQSTYDSIGPAYARIEKLEPYLRQARQLSEVAILSEEHFNPVGSRNSPSDDGAAQMLLELQVPFDVLDRYADFSPYRVIILPDNITLDADTTAKLKAFIGAGGRIIASWHAGLDESGAFALDFGIRRGATPVASKPVYVRAGKELDGAMPETAFVMYDAAETITTAGARVLANLHKSYFNRSYKHWSSHQHAPDDPEAAPVGAAVTEHNGLGYIAFPVFRLYHDMGQPLYKYIVRGLLSRLLPEPVLATDLPSAGRASLTFQASENRHILHLLYGAPQIRGKTVRGDDGSIRVMEMIEDVPTLGPVSATVRLPAPPRRVYDALTGEDIAWSAGEGGGVSVTLPSLRIHRAAVFEAA